MAESGVWSSIAGAVIGAAIGGIASFLITKYQVNTNTKILEYKQFTMPVRLPGNTLVVSADRSALTGKDEDRGVYVPVEDVYGFSVIVQNTGVLPVEKPIVELEVGPGARIIEHNVTPRPSSAYPVEVSTDHGSSGTLQISFPFINAGECVEIALVSTGARQARCKVNIFGIGIKVKEFNRSRGSMRAWAVAVLLWVWVGVLWGVTLISMSNSWSTWLLRFEHLGFRKETVEQVVWPKWVDGLMIVPAIVILLLLVHTARAWLKRESTK